MPFRFALRAGLAAAALASVLNAPAFAQELPAGASPSGADGLSLLALAGAGYAARHLRRRA